ncbi:MAG: GH32 C-terminal domain-containing protein [Bacteroidetes bacterium]|nr:GH32 C-terminal domain-containing protein [Bacteroidota bacterium]
MLKKLLIVLVMSMALRMEAQVLHAEYYRPQYHLSPDWGWMGDPNGMIYFDGKYHLMWWGHALSEDLVHWVQYTDNAMHGGPSGFGYWSGSVVADPENTAGFNTANDTALVAIYTMHYNTTAFEKVGISSSLNHIGFDYYAGNPVINIDQKDFRDPSVFWHEPTHRWIMVIAMAVDRKIDIYSSPDLKTWEYMSSFNNRGGKDQVWETPDLIQLPLNDNPSDMKWVMTCGMGPNKIQYWVGNFDGTSFQLDSLDNLNTGSQVPGEVFANFDGSGFENWQVTGTAFGTGPSSGTLPNQQEVKGFIGNGLVNSFHDGDATTGTLTSPDFQIQKRFINFLIGGGMSSALGIRLYVDGAVVASGKSLQNQETLRWEGWDVTQWQGKTAHIEIVDNETGGWGHILIDQIVFSDVLYNTHFEHGNWADWGKDFYAARSYRNYSSNPQDRNVWIAWMGNWAYANDIPTAPWKGSESIPRSLHLVNQGNGYQLLQYPIEEFQTLRQDPFSMTNTVVDGITSVTGFDPKWNVFEIKASFRIDSKNQVFGINLAENNLIDNRLIIGYNSGTSQLFIDRRKAGLVQFNSGFPSVIYAPTPVPVDSILDLDIFMDQSSVEVFANKNQTVMSALVFTKPSTTGISLFSENGPTTLLDFEAWKMNSIWGITPDQLPNSIHETKDSGSKGMIFPNPVRNGETLSFKSDTNPFVENGAIEVFDLYGKSVLKQELKKSYLNEIRIEGLASELNPGQYALHVQSEKLNLVSKLIIQ